MVITLCIIVGGVIAVLAVTWLPAMMVKQRELKALRSRSQGKLALTYDEVQATGMNRPFWQGGVINPFARTVGSRPARIFGVNTIGLMRRGLAPDVIDKLKRSFRYLLQSKLNTTKAIQKIAAERTLACAEVDYLVDFIRSSQRGVILRRATRKAAEALADE